MVVGCVELPAFLNLGYISPERSLKIYSSAFLLFHVYVCFFKIRNKDTKAKVNFCNVNIARLSNFKFLKLFLLPYSYSSDGRFRENTGSLW